MQLSRVGILPIVTVLYCMQVEVYMQVQFYGMFYKTKGKLKKEGYKYRVPPYGRDETLGRVSNSFFLFLVFVRSKALFSGSW